MPYYFIILIIFIIIIIYALTGIKPQDPEFNVVYNDLIISNNDLLTKEQTSSQPEVQYIACNDIGPWSLLYTVMMIDPDATSPPWLHWLVVNIPSSSDSALGRITWTPIPALPIYKGSVLMSYQGPTPPPGTGRHRYIIKVYQQKHKIESSVNQRANFNSNDFAVNNGLNLVAKKQYFVNSIN